VSRPMLSLRVVGRVLPVTRSDRGGFVVDEVTAVYYVFVLSSARRRCHFSTRDSRHFPPV